MSKEPKISVIMSVRDGGEFLKSAIESILSQSYKDFEFLIANDGSVDNTVEILSEYAQLDSRIHIFNNEKSIGLPASLNILAQSARGCYLARMDADDISLKERLEIQFDYMERKISVDACFGSVNLITHEGIFLCMKWLPRDMNKVVKLLPYINCFAHPTAMIRASSFHKVGGYNELYLKGQDWDLWKRMVAESMRLEIIREVMLNYRLNQYGNSADLSSSSHKSKEFFEANILIQNGHRLKALSLLKSISIFEQPAIILRFCTPMHLFRFLVKIKAKYFYKSAQKILMDQQK